MNHLTGANSSLSSFQIETNTDSSGNKLDSSCNGGDSTSSITKQHHQQSAETDRKAPPSPSPALSESSGSDSLYGEDDAMNNSTWSCPTCTFLNENSNFLTCEMCGETKPEEVEAPNPTSFDNADSGNWKKDSSTNVEEEHQALIAERMKEIIAMQQELWEQQELQKATGSTDEKVDTTVDPELEKEREKLCRQEAELERQQQALQLQRQQLEEREHQQMSLPRPTAAAVPAPAPPRQYSSNIPVPRFRPGAMAVAGPDQPNCGATEPREFTRRQKIDQLEEERQQLLERQQPPAQNTPHAATTVAAAAAASQNEPEEEEQKTSASTVRPGASSVAGTGASASSLYGENPSSLAERKLGQLEEERRALEQQQRQASRPEVVSSSGPRPITTREQQEHSKSQMGSSSSFAPSSKPPAQGSRTFPLPSARSGGASMTPQQAQVQRLLQMQRQAQEEQSDGMLAEEPSHVMSNQRAPSINTRQTLAHRTQMQNLQHPQSPTRSMGTLPNRMQTQNPQPMTQQPQLQHYPQSPARSVGRHKSHDGIEPQQYPQSPARSVGRHKSHDGMESTSPGTTANGQPMRNSDDEMASFSMPAPSRRRSHEPIRAAKTMNRRRASVQRPQTATNNSMIRPAPLLSEEDLEEDLSDDMRPSYLPTATVTPLVPCNPVMTLSPTSKASSQNPKRRGFGSFMSRQASRRNNRSGSFPGQPAQTPALTSRRSSTDSEDSVDVAPESAPLPPVLRQSQSLQGQPGPNGRFDLGQRMTSSLTLGQPRGAPTDRRPSFQKRPGLDARTTSVANVNIAGMDRLLDEPSQVWEKSTKKR